jgi:drug/metabolite transporter (DMT)-like permease
MNNNTRGKDNIFPEWKIVLMMMLAVFVWACAFPFIKIGLEELSFINLTIMRFFVVCTAFILILILQKKRFTKLQKKDIIPLFLLGFLGVMVYHLGLNYGEQFISPSAASLIIATIPVQIVILAVIFLKEKITLLKLLGIILALIGVIIISIWGKISTTLDTEYVFGALAVVIAAIMGAIYTIIGKKYLERYSGLSLTVYAILLGTLGIVPLINFSLFDQVSKMSLNAWFAVLFLGIFSTVIGYVIWYVVLKIKTASETSIYLYLVPILSSIISYFLLKDEITYIFILGGFLVIIGLVIVNMKTKTKVKQKT